MAIRVGNKAEGPDFFDRITEREDFWRYLEGNHLLLTGPRRLGKTSLLQRISEEAAEQGLFARLVDVQGIDSADSFVAELDRAFPDDSIKSWLQAAGSKASAWLDRFRKVDLKLPGGMGGGIEMQAMAKATWTETARQLQQRLSGAPALILVDEFTVFLEKLFDKDRAEAERLLGWLRAWRQGSRVVCRFVFSGSVGFNALLDRHQASTRFNDCHDFQLGPFREKAALAMLEEEAEREGWRAEKPVYEHLCRRTGWLSPFYLNLLLAETLTAARDRELEYGNGGRLQISDIDDGYDRLLASRSRFIHWYQRLERDLAEPDLSLALAILSALAKPDDGLTRKQLLARLNRHEPDPDRRSARLGRMILKLEEDGYLGQDGERIHFLSFLLRDYWRRNHG
jgi:hypothetical protein